MGRQVCAGFVLALLACIANGGAKSDFSADARARCRSSPSEPVLFEIPDPAREFAATGRARAW